MEGEGLSESGKRYRVNACVTLEATVRAGEPLSERVCVRLIGEGKTPDRHLPLRIRAVPTGKDAMKVEVEGEKDRCE
jgi:hypothetical protein